MTLPRFPKLAEYRRNENGGIDLFLDGVKFQWPFLDEPSITLGSPGRSLTTVSVTLPVDAVRITDAPPPPAADIVPDGYVSAERAALDDVALLVLDDAVQAGWEPDSSLIPLASAMVDAILAEQARHAVKEWPIGTLTVDLEVSAVASDGTAAGKVPAEVEVDVYARLPRRAPGADDDQAGHGIVENGHGACAIRCSDACTLRVDDIGNFVCQGGPTACPQAVPKP